jgi:hypothetical protein
METILSIVLGSITTAIAVIGRKSDAKSKKIVKALKVASAAITEALTSDTEV